MTSNDKLLHHNSENWLQRDGNNQPWNWRLFCQRSRWHWSDHCVTNFKVTVRADYAVLHMAPSLHLCTLKTPFESSAVSNWLLDTCLPSPQISGLLNKIVFPFLPTLALSSTGTFQTTEQINLISETLTELLFSVWEHLGGLFFLAVHL